MPWTRASTALCALIGTGASLALVRPNAVEVVVGWISAATGAYFAMADMSGVLARVMEDEAGVAAAVLGMAAVLDSVRPPGERAGGVFS